jgi:hypothetical protein
MDLCLHVGWIESGKLLQSNISEAGPKGMERKSGNQDTF